MPCRIGSSVGLNSPPSGGSACRGTRPTSCPSGGTRPACGAVDAVITPGDTRRVALTGGVVLGNGGATISLLDASGLKAGGVAYTAADARREGWIVTF